MTAVEFIGACAAAMLLSLAILWLVLSCLNLVLRFQMRRARQRFEAQLVRRNRIESDRDRVAMAIITTNVEIARAHRPRAQA